MTNYKQPHKPMTTIEEIVETNNDWIAKVLFAKPGKDTEKAVSDHSTWLTQTLKDYGDAVRAEEDKKQIEFDILGEFMDFMRNGHNLNQGDLDRIEGEYALFTARYYADLAYKQSLKKGTK